MRGHLWDYEFKVESLSFALTIENDQLTTENLLRASIYLLQGVHIIKYMVMKITYFTLIEALVAASRYSSFSKLSESLIYSLITY